MKEIDLTSENFDEVVGSGDKILVDFWAPWCGPCRMIAENLVDAVSEAKDVVLAKVNVDKEPSIADRFRINAIPALKVFKGGKIVNEAVGYLNKEQILKLIK